MASTHAQADRSAHPRRASHPRVAVVGATGAVGQEFLRVLHRRSFPLSSLKLLASSRSAGRTLVFGDESLEVEQLTAESFADVDLALFSAGGSISKQLAPAAVEAGCVVVDNSSAFRMTDGVPLVVPEVNPEAIDHANIGLTEDRDPGVIANPNCSTIIMIVPVTPLHRAFGVKRIVCSTYQAASGAGAAAMAELEQQTREALDPDSGGRAKTMDIFPFQYAFNLFSHNTDIGPDGYNVEETKMVRETRKIWEQSDDDEATRITTTCVRVPVMRAHAESINLTFREPVAEAELRDVLAEAPGIRIVDDRRANRFPTPLDATERDEILVGRIRKDISQPIEGDKALGYDLFVCGDQVLKGAALNAVQIAELLLER
ncbi:MAG: aspartate-semialdehyde dehydrogenase [Phycisphaeraceae bacterium]